MSQTTIIVCVVLFLFLFFVLCTQNSENYNYDIGNDDKDSEANLLQDNKLKLCINEEQREKWNRYYKGCKLAKKGLEYKYDEDEGYFYGGPLNISDAMINDDFCCTPPPQSCEHLDGGVRDKYVKLDSDDVEHKLRNCAIKYNRIREYH